MAIELYVGDLYIEALFLVEGKDLHDYGEVKLVLHTAYGPCLFLKQM